LDHASHRSPSKMSQVPWCWGWLRTRKCCLARWRPSLYVSMGIWYSCNTMGQLEEWVEID
jgi:hypothetical protein